MSEKKLSQKHLHLIILVIILAFSAGTFALLSGKKDLQFLIGFISALSYILWGITYHTIERDLYLRVVLEYVLVASVGLVLLYTVLFL